MIEAQRFPNDFDGLLRARPQPTSWAFSRSSTGSPNGCDSQNDLSPAKRNAAGKGGLAQCDRLDGLADGIISHPAGVTSSPRLCAAPTEVIPGTAAFQTVRSLRSTRLPSRIASRDGSVTHAGFNFGGETKIAVGATTCGRRRSGAWTSPNKGASPILHPQNSDAGSNIRHDEMEPGRLAADAPPCESVDPRCRSESEAPWRKTDQSSSSGTGRSIRLSVRVIRRATMTM